MKKLLVVLVAAVSFTAAAQDFVGNKIELLEGKELKVMPADPLTEKYGYREFYSDAKLQKRYKKKGQTTPTSAVEGKVFKLLSYTPNSTDYILVLDNPETGKIYYKYETAQTVINFPFEVVGGGIPDEAFCDQLDLDKKFSTTEIKYQYTTSTPKLDGISAYTMASSMRGFAMKFSIDEKSATKETGHKGVTLFFENGEKMEFPDEVIEVDTYAGNGGYRYNTTVALTPAQLEKISGNKIVKFQLGPKTQDVYRGNLIARYLKCLSKK